MEIPQHHPDSYFLENYGIRTFGADTESQTGHANDIKHIIRQRAHLAITLTKHQVYSNREFIIELIEQAFPQISKDEFDHIPDSHRYQIVDNFINRPFSLDSSEEKQLPLLTTLFPDEKRETKKMPIRNAIFGQSQLELIPLSELEEIENVLGQIPSNIVHILNQNSVQILPPIGILSYPIQIQSINIAPNTLLKGVDSHIVIPAARIGKHGRTDQTRLYFDTTQVIFHRTWDEEAANILGSIQDEFELRELTAHNLRFLNMINPWDGGLAGL